MAAVTQIRHKHSDGRAYYDKKVAEGKTGKEALRALKRRISDAIYAAMASDARRAAAASPEDPGGQPGNHSESRGPPPNQPNGARRQTGHPVAASKNSLATA